MSITPSPLSEPRELLGARIRRGAGWMVLFKLSERSVGLISTLILARVLTPADFGLVAMAMSVVALTELMGAFGFDIALIQRQQVQRAHYDTAWTFNVLFGIAIALLLLALTIPAASFYREPRLEWVIPVLAIGALIGGFENIGTVNFRKELNFRREFRFLLSKKLATFVVTISLALAFRSYWALIAGMVSGRFFSVWLSYNLHPYRPSLSLVARHDLFHFSKWLFFSNLVMLLQNKSADFILGRTVGVHGLGIYNVAFEIAVLPSSEMIAPLNRAVFPGYAQLSPDLPELRRRFLEVFSLISLIAFPVSIGLACVAAPAVLVLLGPQWVDAIPLIRLLAIAGLAGALQSNLHLVILALGKPKASTLILAVTLIVSLPVFVTAALRYGVVGAAWSYSVFAVVGLCTLHLVFFRITRLHFREYFGTLWRPAVSSAVLAALVLACSAVFESTVYDSSNLLKLSTFIFVGASAYAGTVLLLWRLSGRPQGAEQIVITFVVAKLWNLRHASS